MNPSRHRRLSLLAAIAAALFAGASSAQPNPAELATTVDDGFPIAVVGDIIIA